MVMVFRGQTYCSMSGSCMARFCHRKFEEEEHKAAEEWWKEINNGNPTSEIPISWADFSHECNKFVPRPTRANIIKAFE